MFIFYSRKDLLLVRFCILPRISIFSYFFKAKNSYYRNKLCRFIILIPEKIIDLFVYHLKNLQIGLKYIKTGISKLVKR